MRASGEGAFVVGWSQSGDVETPGSDAEQENMNSPGTGDPSQISQHASRNTVAFQLWIHYNFPQVFGTKLPPP
jgi:hypothetical protein